MRFGSVEIHATLLAVALVLAFQSWTAEDVPVAPSEEIVVWDLPASSVDSIKFLTGKRSLTIERRSDSSGEYLWGVSVRTLDKGKKVTRPFRINSKGTEVFEQLKKLMAKRSLGVLSDEMLKEMKLTGDDVARIEVKAGNQSRELRIGMGAYGGGLKYIQEPKSGTVYVIDAKVLDDLRWGDSRMVEREIVSFKTDQVVKVDLSAGEKQRSWTTAELKNDVTDTWLRKLLRLRVLQYVGKDENIREVDGKSMEATPVLQVVLTSVDDTRNTLKLIRIGEAKTARYYVESDHTHSLVSVSRALADEVERDLPGLFEGLK
jgi:hypothetical protein